MTVQEPPVQLRERLVLEARVDVTAPLADLEVPPEVELVCLAVRDLGTLELPACGGRVPASLIADAVAAEFAWAILGRFLELGHHGWLSFLQQLWGRPGWPESWFYEPPAGAAERAPLRRLRRLRGIPRPWTAIEVAEPLPDLRGEGDLDVTVLVGGAAIGRVSVPAPIRAAELRARITAETGFELCRAAVREALVGAPLAGPPLRERLAVAAACARSLRGRRIEPPQEAALLPGWRRAVHHALGGGAGWVIARHASGAIGTVASRRGELPSEAVEDVLAMAPGVEVRGPGPRRLVYAPDLLRNAPGPITATAPAEEGADPYGRHHFEALFARGTDPWRYTTPYERTKYEQTLGLVPSGPIARGLEIGCAEGHFIGQLSGRVGRLAAADISEIALRRAAGRCREHGNVDFVRLDLTRDPLPGRFDLIVCSETLYFVGDREALAAAAQRMAEALEPDGHLVMAHANVIADDPDRPGFDWQVPFGARTIGETFARTPGLRFLRELRTALYRVQLFRREEGFLAGSPDPESVEETGHEPPDPAVAEHVLWNGGRPAQPMVKAATDRLPILLYHRVAPEGSPATARYRVTPEAFEEQLQYLKDAGFRSVGLDEWAEAMAARRPLQGRRVALTFDDGYRDFLTWAWPALRRHGFTATVFLVADRIGETNQWDDGYGEELPLLGWPEILGLRDEGAAFGSHGWSHRRLIHLPNAEVAQALARSKTVLEKGLERPVTTLAYPWGLSDGAVRHFAGACGYLLGLDSKGGRSPLHGNPLNLPRIEVEGSDGLEAFVAKLGG